MKIQKLFLTLSLLAGMLFAACGDKEQQSALKPQVRLAEVVAGGDVQSTSYPGKTYSSDNSSVAFRVSGTLASVPVKEGQHVRRGQVLAKMDDRDYRVQLQATEAEYAQVKAQADRVIALYEDEGTSQNNYDKARYGLEQITQKLQHHRDQLNDCVVTAPYDGYVQKVFHEAHETVSAGMPVVSVFASGQKEIRIFIPVSEYLKRDRFDKFTATFTSLGNRSYELKLVNIAGSANVNQLYEVKFVTDGTHPEITPGMTAMVSISYSGTQAQNLEVPASAVLHDNTGVAVYVYRDGKVYRTPVEMVFISGEGRATITGDIHVGDRVVTMGVSQLTDQQEVRPYQEPSETNVGGLL